VRSKILKRSIVIHGHKTSVALEDAFWLRFREIATAAEKTPAQLASEIDGDRTHGNLSSAIRLHVLEHYVNRNRYETANPTNDARA
jgi:predicted DNA-binding ribbon-helix-helix protein